MFSVRKSLILSGMIMATATASLLPGSATAQESYTGNVVGGIAGALLGSQIGGGNGKIAAAAAGGILGAVLGGNVERNNAYTAGYGNTQQPYYSAPQQSTTRYQQYEPRYQTQYPQQYETVTYAQPVYAEPVYEQRTYVYASPPSAYVYGESNRGYSRSDWYYRQQREEQRREWRREHDRRDSYGWDR